MTQRRHTQLPNLFGSFSLVPLVIRLPTQKEEESADAFASCLKDWDDVNKATICDPWKNP